MNDYEILRTRLKAYKAAARHYKQITSLTDHYLDAMEEVGKARQELADKYPIKWYQFWRWGE